LGEHLEKVCAAENVKVEKGVIPLVVRASAKLFGGSFILFVGELAAEIADRE